jgi:hypothetical protein
MRWSGGASHRPQARQESDDVAQQPRQLPHICNSLRAMLSVFGRAIPLAAVLPLVLPVQLRGTQALLKNANDNLKIEQDFLQLVVVQTLEVEPIRDLEVTADHAASTAFQISDAVLLLMRSRPSLN